MKKILRVEHPQDGVGPYHRPDAWDVVNWHSVDTDHPGPLNDNFEPRWRDKSTRFGFASKDQLDRWFPETDRQRLAELGYQLATYTAPAGQWAASRKQAVFHGPSAQRIAVEPLHQPAA
jgi:hypothetical protein